MWRILSSLALMTGMMLQAPGSEMIVKRPVWRGREPGSPPMPSTGFGLWFKLVPGRAEGSTTLALLGATRLPGRYVDIYGGRIPGAIEVIAIDVDTGKSYHAAAESVDAVPLRDAMNPSPEPPPKGVARVQDAEDWFNVDLRAQLGLPSRAGVYDVFLWLDELTSSVVRANLPGRGPSSLEAHASPESVDVHWAPLSEKVPGRAISLSVGADRRLYGAASPVALTGARFLTLLALNYRSRELAARSVVLPRDFAGGFDLDPKSLSGALAAGEGKVFLLAEIGGVLSNVLALKPEAQEGGAQLLKMHKVDLNAPETNR
jgi:hypothetical protein